MIISFDVAGKMSLLAAFALLQLIVPTILALPAHQDLAISMPRDGCDIGLQVAGPTEVRGEFEEGEWTISFHAVLREDVIYSTTTLKNASSDNEGLVTQLAFPATQERVIPQIEKLVVEAAAHVVETTVCNIPDGLNQIYEDLADRLYKCTKDLGQSQLRFSVMYHETIISSAKRMCSGAESICTPSPEYVYNNGLFICSEDLEEFYPEKMAEAKIKMEEIKQRGREEQALMAGEERGKRHSWWCSLWPLCGTLEGSDYGCCGNYGGCCWYCHPLCYVHDHICVCCDFWHCGWACQEENGC